MPLVQQRDYYVVSTDRGAVGHRPSYILSMTNDLKRAILIYHSVFNYNLGVNAPLCWVRMNEKQRKTHAPYIRTVSQYLRKKHVRKPKKPRFVIVDKIPAGALETYIEDNLIDFM